MIKHRKKSFIKNSIIFDIISVTIILVLFIGILTLVNYNLERSFIILDDMLKYEDKLQNDEYSKIPLKKFHNCSIIIYDSNKKILYSSNKKAGENISSSDINYINEYYVGEYFIVYDLIKKDNQKEYYIMKVKMDEQSENEKIIDFAILNSNLEVINGNLFGEVKKISEFQFDLIKGTYKDYTIEKYQYKNSEGEQRTLVFIAPDFTVENYEKALKKANSLWILLLPLILIVLFVEILLYKRELKKCIEPLKSIITSYERKNPNAVNNDEMPIEFQPIANKFKLLLEKIDKNELEKNKMIANISHDLKTPLTAIEGYAQAFKDNIVPEDKKEKYLNAIYEKSILATYLINRLFEYTKLEHPEYKLNLVESDINSFSREYLAQKYPEIEMKGFILNAKIPENECICCLDRELFTRLYDNLVSNILKYNNQGTEILFEIIDQSDKVKIIISDNGIGIPKDVKENLFEPFVTGNKARTSGEGTGLGMAIVKKIVDLHNGNIKLDENTIKGYTTQFNIELNKFKDKS